MSNAIPFELTERLTPDIVAQRIGEQCDLIKPPEAGRGTGGVPRQRVGHGNWGRWSSTPDDVLRCRRSRRWDSKRKAAIFATEWSVGGGLGNHDCPVLAGARLRLRIRTAADGYSVEVRLFQRGKRSRLFALVDGRLADADAEAVRLQFETERIAAKLGG